MRVLASVCAAVVLFGAPGASAEIVRLTEACETALALSAGPTYMREGAGVYVLGDDGYRQVRESANGYACMVTREGVNSNGLAPQCFDKVGQASHIPMYLDEAKLRLDGVSQEDRMQARAEGLSTGKYRTAQGPGVVYMASAYNYVFNGRGDQLLVGPHVMYHAPFVTSADIGATPAALANPGMPFLNTEGPHGFMIGFTQNTTDSSDVEKACAGQLPDKADWRPFPVSN